ncbi:unnamed protein product, partial [Porites lobata]
LVFAALTIVPARIGHWVKTTLRTPSHRSTTNGFYRSCCWISLFRYGGSWRWLVSTTVNLTRRLDTGRINSSPVSRSPAIICWSEGCPSQSVRIPIEDADGDVVKCRYAKYSESYFNNDSFPYGTFDE